MPSPTHEAIQALCALLDRVRPGEDPSAVGERILAEAARLQAHPEAAAELRDQLRTLLDLPRQATLFAEVGVRSALGLGLELAQRVRHRLLPPVDDDAQLDSILGRAFHHPRDPEWLAAVPPEAWSALADALDAGAGGGTWLPRANLLESVRILSFRIAGTALDRELLRADPALEGGSPFLAQNVLLLPALERAARGGEGPTPAEAAAAGLLLDACQKALEGVRRGALEKGISLRLTYQVSRLGQLVERLRLLLQVLAPEEEAERPALVAALVRTLVAGHQDRHRILPLLTEDVGLLARNVTDHASRHGEHYIAENRSELGSMALSACGGGVIIAFMATLKLRLSLQHLPPLTEGIVFGFNYGLGFILIHLLGFSVATKQPAMTAASIAATLDEAHPRDLHKLVDLVQNLIRTQFVAVLGNVALAVPMAVLLALAWGVLGGAPIVPPAKALKLLHDVNPLATGALIFAGVAGVGLFLSGLVSGYFDNRTRYHELAPRVAAAPLLGWLGRDEARRLGNYLDRHCGAILGNLFFGLYLGLMGALDTLTGLPVDIRHVAFSSANVGTALVVLDGAALREWLPWAVAGVLLIALVNLVVSFSLALYVAMRSRLMSAAPILELGALLARRFREHPLSFFMPPPA
jgi:site-specific recombinase